MIKCHYHCCQAHPQFMGLATASPTMLSVNSGDYSCPVRDPEAPVLSSVLAVVQLINKIQRPSVHTQQSYLVQVSISRLGLQCYESLLKNDNSTDLLVKQRVF